jgi:hypothetical protein
MELAGHGLVDNYIKKDSNCPVSPDMQPHADVSILK